MVGIAVNFVMCAWALGPTAFDRARISLTQGIHRRHQSVYHETDGEFLMLKWPFIALKRPPLSPLEPLGLDVAVQPEDDGHAR